MTVHPDDVNPHLPHEKGAYAAVRREARRAWCEWCQENWVGPHFCQICRTYIFLTRCWVCEELPDERALLGAESTKEITMADDKPEPIDPMTQLAAGAAQIHELFLSFVAAGFNEVQALQLVIAVLQKPNQ